MRSRGDLLRNLQSVPPLPLDQTPGGGGLTREEPPKDVLGFARLTPAYGTDAIGNGPRASVVVEEWVEGVCEESQEMQPQGACRRR